MFVYDADLTEKGANGSFLFYTVIEKLHSSSGYIYEAALLEVEHLSISIGSCQATVFHTTILFRLF